MARHNYHDIMISGIIDNAYLTLFVPAYFDVSGTRGGHIVPPLNIFGLGRVRVPILFGNYLPRSYLPYTKGFMKFGCPEPSKKVFDF